MDKTKTIKVPMMYPGTGTVEVTLYLCSRCGKYGFPSMFGPICTKCENEIRSDPNYTGEHRIQKDDAEKGGPP